MSSNIPLSLSVRRAVERRDKLTCIYCGFRGDSFEKWMQLELDHIKPLQYGGADAENNLATCCNSCNKKTANYHPEGNLTIDEIISAKRSIIFNSRKADLGEWLKQIV